MKPIKFRIKNFKSIEDSGDCYFDDELTIFAGKNESGKSTILDALAMFDERNKINNSTPIDNPDSISEISVTFSIEGDRLEELLDGTALIITEKPTNLIFNLSKNSKEDDYIFSDEISFLKRIKLKSYEDFFDNILKKKLISVIPELNGMNSPESLTGFSESDPFFDSNILLNNIEGSITRKSIEIYKIQENQNEKNVTKSSIQLTEKQINSLKKINEMLKLYGKLEDDKFLESYFVNFLVERYLPYWIKFDSFEDQFPDKIKIEDLENNEWALALEKISDFNISKISSEDRQMQRNVQASINTNFSDIFREYWTQDDIKLEVNKDGEFVEFWINENNQSYLPSQRSKGQQWYLSFYILVVSKMRETSPNVILIDEPGLYLHAIAQKDLLKVLRKQFKNNIVLFSTHSPYLIEDENLKNIRLVEKQDGHTTIINKYWKNAKKDTLKPILTAIGINMSSSLTDQHVNNVVVEGLEDVFYMRAFKKMIKNEKNINFISGGGAANVGRIGNILFGWGLQVKYMFDNDKAGKSGQRKLIKDFGVDSNDIVFCSEIDNYNLVDLLSVGDFEKIILPNIKEEIKKDHKNSDYITNEKPLIAKKFLEDVENEKFTFSDETIKNIKMLFDSLIFM